MAISSLNRFSATTDQPTLNIPEELQNSAEKILSYAGISREKANTFQSNLEIFINMKNKAMSDAAGRQIREQLSLLFFETYTSVLKKVLAENNPSRLYKMFLYFGYMDERLLSVEQINTLYKLADQGLDNVSCSVFDMKSWLDQIYSGSKQPSVNEFGQDYQDIFLVKKKQGELTDKDKPAYDSDRNGRLSHETENLFKLGQRLSYGQVSGFFPILHQDMICRDLETALVTPDKIKASLNKILQVDFSAFHREIVYSHAGKQLAPELIMKPVLPDIVLMPGFGHRGVMWQVLSGKSKTSPGRFIFPIFTDENMDNLMIEVVAKFRWDLSKNMSGSVVNKANEISLYTDYSDYVQFYAKNRDLSGEAKEKLKTEIKRHRNNLADMFVLDYNTWISYESKGLLRLNKVAREIMFKHCPFAKPVRANLEKSPLYNTLLSQFDKIRVKQCRILESRYAKLAAPNASIHPDLAENLVYYNA